MTYKQNIINSVTAVTIGTSLVIAPTNLSLAAPGTLSDTPLFISSAVQPNIMFLIDDSGSMFWTDLLNAGTNNPGGAPYPLTDVSADNPPGTSDNNSNRETRRFLCRGFNVMAYDATVLYTPWEGKDSANAAYTDLTLTTARSNPYNTTTTDISTHYYWPWTDTGNDGAYGDSSVSGGDAAYAGDECGDVSSNSGGVLVTSLPATGTPSAPNSQRNFANWYSYFRRREYVVKRALSEIIDESDARVGLTTLWDNNSVRTLIEDIDDISLPVDATAQSNKATLLENLFGVTSSGGTPLRTSLENVGEYFLDGGSWDTSSPILNGTNGGTCQQNFSVVMSDGYWNGGTNPGVGDADSNNNTTFDGGVYADGDTGSTISNTLADVAMHYYETDLSNLADEVPTTDVDTNTAQHMVTYTVAFGINGTLSADPAITDTIFNWPTPSSGTSTTVDDMRHAAWNGRGLFLNAQDPAQLVTSLRSAIGSIQGRTGSAASVAFNSGSLSTNSEIYLALFNSERWSGDLLAYPLDPTTGVISGTKSWSAATQLDGRNLGTSPRTILTFNGTDGTDFNWSSLTTAQKNDLRTGPSGSTDDDATAAARLGYLRGDRACEVGSPTSPACSYTSGSDTFNTKTLRERTSRLGDILQSGPVFVGAPESNWPDIAPFPNTTGSLYSEYYTSNSSRSGTIYAGGNDGMLHAFEKTTGNEIMAFIPNAVYSTSITKGLHYLTDPGYTHQYYVDQTPTISDAYIKTTTAGSTAWNTVLIGGLRGGGRALFALDVSDPSAYSETTPAPENTVMWEFDSSDDTDLGFTYSQPVVVALEGPSNTVRWAAIFGNGYNDLGSGEAKLFILFLEAGLDGVWDAASSDYIEITTGVGDTSTRNGLASPAIIDNNGDGLADRVYAGDLQGNMWAFDLSGSDMTQWNVASMSGTTPVPLFTGASNQPITTSPVIVRNSDIPSSASNAPNTLVIFGTGQYLTTADITTTNTQSMYGVWDKGTASLTRSNLVEQTISTGTTSESITGRALTNATVDYSGTDYGWYMDFISGERSITDPVIRGDLLFFNTTIPDTAPCDYGGTGWLMVAKWINGGNPDSVAFDINGDFDLTALDKIGSNAAAGTSIVGLPTSPVNLGNKRYVATTETDDGSSIDTTEIEKIAGPGTGRLSWEEMEL